MVGFLKESDVSSGAQRLFDQDLADVGFVMNVSRLWAHQPDTLSSLFELLAAAKDAGGFDRRQLGVLVTATASALGDSYCALAWGHKLATAADPDTAASVLRGDDRALSPAEAAMARWARRIVEDPSSTTQAEVDQLRDAGFGDAEIFAMTVFVALRLAFSTINDALGATPDAGLRDLVPQQVLDAVTFGRPVDDDPPSGS